MDQQQTEEQSGEDESESFKETLSVGSGNLSSLEITIIFKCTRDHVYFSRGSTTLVGTLLHF